MGFVKSDRSCGYTRWFFYHYCGNCFHDANEQLWTRLKPFKIGA